MANRGWPDDYKNIFTDSSQNTEACLRSKSGSQVEARYRFDDTSRKQIQHSAVNFGLNWSRDSGCGFPTASFSASQSIDTSFPNQTRESGFGCDSFNSFNQFQSINNICYDGCFFEDDDLKTNQIEPLLKSSAQGILATAISHGGDFNYSSIKKQHEAKNCYDQLNHIVKLRKNYKLICEISDLRYQLTNKKIPVEQPLELNTSSIANLFEREFYLVHEHLANSKLETVLGSLTKIMSIINTSKWNGSQHFDDLQDYIQLLHWILTSELLHRKSLNALSMDQDHVDKAYVYWNTCS